MLNNSNPQPVPMIRREDSLPGGIAAVPPPPPVNGAPLNGLVSDRVAALKWQLIRNMQSTSLAVGSTTMDMDFGYNNAPGILDLGNNEDNVHCVNGFHQVNRGRSDARIKFYKAKPKSECRDKEKDFERNKEDVDSTTNRKNDESSMKERVNIYLLRHY